jgi:hypothetical protein
MVKVLDGEKDGHGEREKTDHSKDDLKTEALKEPNLCQGTLPLSQFAPSLMGEGCEEKPPRKGLEAISIPRPPSDSLRQQGPEEIRQNL